MNSKSKMFLAIFAVAIMIGGALVPLAYTDNSVSAAEETEDESASFSLETLIEKFKEKITEIGDIEIGNGLRLVPTGVSEVSAAKTISSVEGAQSVSNGEVATLANGTIEFKDDAEGDPGVLTVEDGGTLVLFPMGKDSAHTITVSNGSPSTAWYQDVINAEPGANIVLFGMSYKVSGTEETTLLSVRWIELKEGNLSCTFAFKNAESSNTTVAITVGANTHIMMGEKLGLYYNPFKEEVKVGDKTIPKDHADISFQGTLAVDMENYTINMSGFMLIDASFGGIKKVENDIVIQGHARLNNTIHMTPSKTSTGMHLEAGVDVSIASINEQIFAITDEGKLAPLAVVDNGTVQTGNIELTADIGMSGGSVDKVSFTLTKEKDLKIAADKFAVFATWTSPSNVALQIKAFVNNLDLTIGNTALIAKDVKIGSTLKEITLSSLSAKTSISIGFDSIIATVTEPIELTERTFVKDFLVKIDGLELAYDAAKNVNELKFTEISAKVTACKDLFPLLEAVFSSPVPFEYDATLEIKICNFSSSADSLEYAMTTDLGVKIGAYSNGKERALELGVTGLRGNYDRSDESFTTGIGKITLSNDLSLDIFKKLVDKFSPIPWTTIESIKNALGIGSAKCEFVIENLTYDSETDKVTAGSISVTMKNGLKYKEAHIEFSNVSLSEIGVPVGTLGFIVPCEKVTGYTVSYSEKKNSFSITDSPTVGLGVDLISMTITLIIEKGNAKFEGGKTPFGFIVGSEAKFSADGLLAPLFIFKEGCQKSGTVVLDPDAFYYKSEDMTYKSGLLRDGDYTIITGDSLIRAEMSGYKLIINLSDVDHGTIEAKKGFILPATWTGETGFSMESRDNSTGTFTITRNSSSMTLVDIHCDKKSYTLSYEDDYYPSETYHYGDYVRIPSEGPEKEGYTFLGWTDGSGAIYGYHYSVYTMPARDVTLTPVYTKTVTPEVVLDEEGNKTLVVDATDVPLVIVSGVTQIDWTSMTIKTKNVSVTFSQETYYEISGNGYSPIMFGCIASENIDNEDIAEIAEGKSLYAMKLYNARGEIDYSGYTEFKVTVNVHVSGDVRDFKVQYVNENGYVEEVGVDSFKRCADGSYDVTFTVNHFSLYAIEPVYKSTLENVFVLVILIIAIIVVCAFLIKVFGKKSEA